MKKRKKIKENTLVECLHAYTKEKLINHDYKYFASVMKKTTIMSTNIGRLF